MADEHWIGITPVGQAGRYIVEMDAMSDPTRYRHCRVSAGDFVDGFFGMRSDWIDGRPEDVKTEPIPTVLIPDANMTRAELALRDGSANDVAHELLAERKRQIAEEGWTPKHDERHTATDLAFAGAAYALSAGSHDQRAAPGIVAAHAAAWWPFIDGFKPKDMRRDLVRAGALVIAAIERLDREIIRDGEGEAS